MRISLKWKYVFGILSPIKKKDTAKENNVGPKPTHFIDTLYQYTLSLRLKNMSDIVIKAQ